MTTFIWPKNLPEISCIQLPGKAQGSGSAAVRALGGLETLTKVLGSSKASPTTNANSITTGCLNRHRIESDVFLRINPEDRYSRFLFATPLPSRDLLVKIRRNKHTGKVMRIIPVGAVIERTYFETMADFICLPPEPLSRECRFDVEHEFNENSPEPFYLPPPAFTRVVSPFNYRFEENAFAPKLRSTAGGETQLASNRRTCCDTLNPVAKFSDPEVPKEPTPYALQLSVDPKLETILRRLFEERPVWLRGLLDHRIIEFGNYTMWKKKPALARCSYVIADGPWRGCLCRLGYDPKKDPESRFFQSVDFRDPHFRSIGCRTATASFKRNISDYDQFTFRSPPLRPSQLYQLCAIEDETIQSLIRNAPVQSECSRDSGWFTSDLLTKVRDIMVMRSKELRCSNLV